MSDLNFNITSNPALAKLNNLDDLSNFATARSNLGLGTGNSPTFTGATLSGLTLGSVVFAGTGGVLSQNNARLFWDDVGAGRLGIGTATPLARVDILQPAASSGTPRGLRFTGGAHTTLTAAETNDIDFDLSRTVEFTAGATIVNQRAFSVQAPTYSATAAQTITKAATLAITAAPTAGLNMTIQDSYAFWVQAGISRFNGNLSLGANIILDTTPGTKIGTATTQKLGFYGATPIAQGAGVADATDAASAITQLNALISRIEATGLIATI